MWVTVPAVVLLAIVAIQDVNGHTGQPWPASAAGYANFSQVKPQVPTKVVSDVPVIQSSPTTSNIINLDLSNSNANLAETLEGALASKLVNVKPSNQQQTIPIILNITPPPNTKQDFVKELQEAIKVALSKLIPSAGSSLSIAITQSSSGVIVNIKANLDVIVPAKTTTPTLPPSAVPEIDLTESSSGLLQDLQSILQIELPQAGYNPNSKSVQNFTFSFSVLPPAGATKDYVRLYILGPLQAVLKQIAPGAALTSVSVNTQQSNQKILRQTVKFSVQIVPPAEFKMNSNLIEVPEVDLNAAGNVVNTVISTLQNEITKNVAVNPSQAKTLSIPFKITPPTGATQQQIQELYINPISQVLSTLDPTGKIIKINQKTVPNGDVIILIYMNIPASTTITTASNAEIQPPVVAVALPPPETTNPVTKNEEINNEAQPPVNIVNRNSFPEGEEDEIPEISEETSESTESETSKPSSNEDVVPSNAIRTSVVDLTTPTASIKNVKQILDEELSPLANPKNDGQPKVLAIPFRMKPPAGATPQEIEKNVVAPLGKLLTSIEPTGNVITSETKPLPNGDLESVVYFNIPSVDNSKTYKVISDELKASETSTIVPAKIASTKETITPKAVQTNPTIKPTVSQVISQNNQQPQKQITPSEEPIVHKVVPKTELPQPQIGKQPESTVITSPIYLKDTNSANIPSDIVQILKELKKNPNGQPPVIGIPFILPGRQKPNYFLTNSLRTVVETFEPKDNVVLVGKPKTLPNGDTQFIIYDVSPAVYEEKPSEQPTKPTEKPIIPQVTSENNQQPQKQITPSEEPIAPKVVPKTELPQPQIGNQPENTVLTSPIYLKDTNLANIPSDIVQSLKELRKNLNGQPKVIGIPFILPGNQKPNYSLAQSLKNVVETLEPKGNIVSMGQPKTYANGETHFIIYDVSPEVTEEKPSEQPTKPTEKPIVPQVTSENNQQPQKQTTPSEEPIVPKVVPKTELPQPQIEKQPENTVLTSPIYLKYNNSANIPSYIVQSLKELKKNPNGQPKVIGIPFILPGNQKPSYFLTQYLKDVVETLEPKGNIVTIGEPKTLANGETQFIIYDVSPAVTEEEPSEQPTKPNEKPVVPQVTSENNQQPQKQITPSVKPIGRKVVPKTKPTIEPTTSQVVPENNQLQQEQTTPSVEPIAPKVVPKTEVPQPQNEVQPENAIITSPIDLKQPNLANLPSAIAQSLDQLKKDNNGQPQVVGIPFVLPGNQKPNFILTQALKTVLTTLEPSSNILQVSEPKQLPNGDTQFIIYDEISPVTNKKPSEEPIKPTEEPTTSQVISENNQLPQKQTNPSVEPIAPKVVPKTEAPQSQNEVQPENAIITSPIDLKQPNLSNLPSDIAQSLDQLKKNNNGQPQVVGIPFILPGNQKPNFLLKQALKTVLTTLEPSGNILQVSEPKQLPNGDTQFIIYDEIPAVTNKKPSEEPTKPTEEPTTSQVISENNQLQQKQTNPSVESIASNVVPKTEAPQSQNEVQPENAIITSPIDLKHPNLANLPSDIAQSLDQLKKNNNGQPQVVGIPFVLPGNQKPNFLLKQALKTVLTTLEPSGNILQVSEPKQLPNGDTQFIIYDEIPAVTYKKPSEEPTKPTVEPTTSQVVSENNQLQQKQTNPSVEPIAPKVVPKTEAPQSQNEVQPEKAILTSPIDLKQPNLANLLSDIAQSLDQLKKNNNGQPQVVGIPFILPGNQKPNFLLKQALKTVLTTLEPSGNILQVSEPKQLPNGDTQFIIYDKIPAVTNKKPSEEPTNKDVEPTTSQVISENNQPQQKQTIRSVEPNVVPETKQIVEPIAPGVLPNTKPTIEPRMPKMISENKQPISQNELQPENVIILEPIDLKNPDYVRLPHEIGKTIDKVGKARIGQPQIVGLPFILSGNVKPNFLLTQSLKTMLQTLEPSGNIIQVTEPKVLPNGDTEFIIYDELPAITNLKKNKDYVKNIGKSLDDIEKLTPHEPIVFPVDLEPNNEIPNVGKNIIDNVGVNLPVAAVEDVNLDQDGVSLGGEVTKALTKATSQILSSNSNQNEPVKLKFDIYTHLKNKLSDNIELVNDVSNELLAIEPNAKVITADTNDKPGSKGPDGVVEIVVPSIASSKIAQSLKNALKIPTIDINVPKSKLLDIIENLLQNGLKSIGQLNPKVSQIFDLNFRLNPFDPKGSVNEALKALKTVDPTGQIISHKIKSGPDGWDYFNLVYQIPKLEDSTIYQVVKPNEPEVTYESFVNIDTKNPFDGLLENVVKVVGAAEDEVQGAKEGQLVDLPLDFKFTNSRGLSDSRVSEIISQTLPSIRGYISQILPDGKIVSVDTIGLPDSDDVVLKIVVNTPYEPDDTIVIEEVRPNTRTVVTTPKPKSRGLFGILGL